MKSKLAALVAVMFTFAAASALAGGSKTKASKTGEVQAGGNKAGKGKKAYECTASTQECLDHMAASLAHRGWVGVELEPSGEGPMTVVKVIENSPADQAGLMAGDVLVAANGVDFSTATMDERKALQEGMTPGSKLVYTVKRAGAEKKVEVELSELPERVRFQIIGGHMVEHARAADTQS